MVEDFEVGEEEVPPPEEELSPIRITLGPRQRLVVATMDEELLQDDDGIEIVFSDDALEVRGLLPDDEGREGVLYRVSWADLDDDGLVRVEGSE